MSSRPAYFERLLNLLRRRGRSVEDAEDLIQEAMLRLHVYGHGKKVANQEGFLRHAVKNMTIDEHRHERPDLRRKTSIDEMRGEKRLVAGEPTPSQAAESNEGLAKVAALLETVSPLTRLVFMAHRAGYTYAEIAAHFHIAEITVERHITRALMALMEHRTAELPADGEANLEAAIGQLG